MARDYNMTHEALEFTTNVYGCTTRTNQQRVRQPTSSRQPWLRSRHRSLSDSPTRTSIGISQQPFATWAASTGQLAASPPQQPQPQRIYLHQVLQRGAWVEYDSWVIDGKEYRSHVVDDPIFWNVSHFAFPADGSAVCNFSRKVSGPSAPPKPRLQPSNQPFRWAGAWRFAYEIAFTNMDFFVDQDASIFNLPEDAPWGIWVSLTLGGRISELVNG